MVLGHYALALAARRAAPRLKLGTAILATELLDELWPIFLLLGIEHVRIVPGITAVNGFDFVSYPYTHSLLAAVVWGLLAGSIYYGIRRDGKSAAVMGALVVSHWVLDVPMHRPDLPLWPGSSILLGFGLWRSIPITLALEGAMFAAGTAIYVRLTRPFDRTGTWALVALLVTVSVGFVVEIPFGPADELQTAFAALTLWLFIPWGWWIDRHRTARDEPA